MLWPDEASEMVKVDSIGGANGSVHDPYETVSVTRLMLPLSTCFKTSFACRMGMSAMNTSVVLDLASTSALVGKPTRRCSTRDDIWSPLFSVKSLREREDEGEMLYQD